MTYTPVAAIEVIMWGRRVGVVGLNRSTGLYGFRFDPDWVATGVELAPFHMPLVEGHTYEFGLDDETFWRLPPMLADALPDRFGNALVDRWMAEQGIDRNQFSVLDRLAYAADRSIGALEFVPALDAGRHDSTTAVQLADLVVAARRAVATEPAPVDAQLLEQLIAVGSSAGGARPKAIVAYHPGTNQIRSAYRDLPDGFEHWLFKLDGTDVGALDGHDAALSRSAPWGRIEYAYFRMATAAGVDMAPSSLLAEGPRRHFITRRFDREPDGAKHHVISLCALDHLDFNMVGAHSYDQYLAAVRRLGLNTDALDQAFRRMVFNVAAANCDDHTKNFAFLRREGRDFELAPAFDVTYSYNPTSPWVHQHLMSVNGKSIGIDVADLWAVGERHDVPGYRRIVREVLAAVDEWPTFAAASEVPEAATADIAATLAQHRPT